MDKNFKMSRYLLNQRVTKLSTEHEDVDEWLDIFRFKLFNFNDETYYVRYLVIDSIQCKITISCFIENTATVFIQNCENGKSYQERIEFQPFRCYEDKRRVQILCDSFIRGFKYLNVDLKCAENYFDFIMNNRREF